MQVKANITSLGYLKQSYLRRVSRAAIIREKMGDCNKQTFFATSFLNPETNMSWNFPL